MGEGFSISGSDVQIAGAVEIVEQLVRNTAQLNDFLTKPELPYEVGSGVCLIFAGVFVRVELAGQNQADRSGMQLRFDYRNRANQSFKISIIIVMAYE